MKEFSFNKQTFIIATASLIMASTVNISSSSETRTLEVLTIDEKNLQVKPEIINWWFSDTPDMKNTLVCKQDDCSTLIISGNSSSPVTVYALLSKMQENDTECWDWYEAETESQAHQKQITLRLSHKRTVCK